LDPLANQTEEQVRVPDASRAGRGWWLVACCLLVFGACESRGDLGDLDATLGRDVAPAEDRQTVTDLPPTPIEPASPGRATFDPRDVATANQVRDTNEREAVRRAALEYVRRETRIQNVTIEIGAIADGWARVRVVPATDVTDPAILYLRRDGDRWVGVILGTGFTPDDLDRLDVPASVRPSSM
jgi:hypothetical protein